MKHTHQRLAVDHTGEDPRPAGGARRVPTPRRFASLIGPALFAAIGGGCGSDSGPLSSVDALIILQRPARNEGVGDIFQYTSYKPGARILKLSPPTADGNKEVICCNQVPGFEQADISGYDLSFDAKEIVFSAQLAADERYGLFILNLDTGAVDQLPTDPARHYISPIFLPNDRIMFTTNRLDEAGALQFEDEYNRGVTLQLGRINRDGTGEELAPRNLSHRTFPTLTSDGRVMFTQWDHLGELNAGHLMFVNQDMRNLREGFGKEGTGAANSTLKAREISPGRFIAVATSREKTVQAGALIDIRLGTIENDDGDVSAPERRSEANATYKNLTPDVPRDEVASPDNVGRYYDAFALNAKERPDVLVSWAPGPVETEELALAGLSADFGVYLLDSKGNRLPILNDVTMWDVAPRPLQTRSAPEIVGSASDPALQGQLLVGAMNVYDSSLKTFEPGSIYGVRVIEGFSSEEGNVNMFGTTMFEGQASLGVAPVRGDGSWLATVPANVPIALQAIDKFGMALLPETVWISGGKGESMVCGGCHEPRDKSTVINPGITQAAAIGPTPMFGLAARATRRSTDGDLANAGLITVVDGKAANHEKLMGMAWDKAIQPVFAKCVGCHDASNTAGIAPYTIRTTTGETATWTFNLSGEPAVLMVGGVNIAEGWSASYFSIAGPDMEEFQRANLTAEGNFKVYAKPQNARESILIQKVNPTQLFPAPGAARAFTTPPHSQDGGGYTELTATEFYKLILMADHGVNFYARENKPAGP